MDDLQCVQWRPINMMQRTTVQRSTCGTGTITRHYQWRRRIWSGRNQKTLKKGMGTQYLVHWKGYGNEHDQWIAETGLPHAKGVIEDYWTRISSQNL